MEMKNTFNEIHFDIRLGDCLDVLKALKENSVDSVVCDPPYGLSFMGKKWDYDVPSQEIWEECLRVLKPGGHLLAFAGSRTYHRMAVRIEDAGFEIRDQIMWIYGSGFPKSHNIGKSVDKIQGNERGVIGEKKRGDVQKAKKNGSGYLADPANRNNVKQFGYGTEIITKGNSAWEGWGTALKPAHEPIVMARKPFKGNVAQNVLEWGTGGINIDDSRIGLSEGDDPRLGGKGVWSSNKMAKNTYGDYEGKEVTSSPLGRFPANVIIDGSNEVLNFFPNTKKAGNKKDMNKNLNYNATSYKFSTSKNPAIQGDEGGSAARFFYCPKASKKDRNEGLDEFEDKEAPRRDDGQPYGMNTNKFRQDGSERKPVQPKKNNHPTIKPTDLMRYLIRLVTPSGGITLDPFMGSGSTGKAALKAGFSFIGIEREEEYFEIAKARLEHQQKKNKGKQINLFD
jgi:site-specific DNA-methyltransferase (adenine-specific)